MLSTISLTNKTVVTFWQHPPPHVWVSAPFVSHLLYEWVPPLSPTSYMNECPLCPHPMYESVPPLSSPYVWVSPPFIPPHAWVSTSFNFWVLSSEFWVCPTPCMSRYPLCPTSWLTVYPLAPPHVWVCTPFSSPLCMSVSLRILTSLSKHTHMFNPDPNIWFKTCGNHRCWPVTFIIKVIKI